MTILRDKADAVVRLTTLSAVIAQWASSLVLEDVPPDVIALAERQVLDTIGCGLAALALDSATAAQRAAAGEGSRGRSTVIGMGEEVSAQDAALANGMLCHGLDFDDTMSFAFLHPGSVIVPAAVAAAEEANASGQTLLKAIVAGNEVVARLGSAAPVIGRAFHATSAYGVFGATSAAAVVRDLDVATFENALGVAASIASGVTEFLHAGAEIKPLHAGLAARGGLLASSLAMYGAKAPSTAIEGKWGAFAGFAGLDEVDASETFRTLGGEWYSRQIGIKAYPACLMTHSSIDAAAAAWSSADAYPEQIAEINVAVPESVVPIVFEPRPEKVRPSTPHAAKFSAPFGIASMIIDGRVDVMTYRSNALNNPDVHRLADKVSYRTTEFSTFPQSYPAEVTIRLQNGQMLNDIQLLHRGGPDNPMSDHDVSQKFRRNAELALDRAELGSLATVLAHLNTNNPLRGMFSVLKSAHELHSR